MLGGMTGAGLTAAIVQTVGANTLLLWSAFALVLCAVRRLDRPRPRAAGGGRGGGRGR